MVFIQKKKRTVDWLHRECFLYPVMQSWTFNSLSVKNQQVDLCRQYAEEWEQAKRVNEGLLLWGKVGTEKTCLAADIANALLEQGVAVRIINLSEIINYGFEGRQAYIQKLCSCPLLILDNPGMERDTKFGLETVFKIIDGRLMNRKPLIVTTNLTLDEMKHPKNTDTERIYDRLLSITVPIQFAGENLRKKLREEQRRYIRKFNGKGGGPA